MHVAPQIDLDLDRFISVKEVFTVREGFKKPRHGNFPLGGTPPRGLHGRDFSEKLAEKGDTPPLNGQSVSENVFFLPKNTIFGPIFNGFFLNRKGVPPPLHGRSVPENLTEKS